MSKSHYALLALPLALVACGVRTKTKIVASPRVETVQVPVTVPGVPQVISVPQIVMAYPGFQIATFPGPIATATPLVQELGKAIAKVQHPDEMGSGFFISPDGLFLTNEHVIPMKGCVKAGCPGIKIVRDFRPGGEVKVYTQFEVIAQSDSDLELDFTLLKVKLAPGETVPYLKLELDAAKYRWDESDGRTFKALGHPGGATLRATNVRPFRTQQFSLEMRGLVIPGNSGGALVDDTTGKVLGLVKQTAHTYVRVSDQQSADETYGRATQIIDWARNLKAKNLWSAELENALNPEHHALAALEADAAIDIKVPPVAFPAPAARRFKGALLGESDEFASEALSRFAIYFGTAQEQAALALMFTPSDIRDGNLNLDNLSALLNYQVEADRAINFTDEQRQRIAQMLENGTDDDAFMRLGAAIRYSHPNMSEVASYQQACVDALNEAHQPAFIKLYYCRTTKDHGQSILPDMLAYLRQQSYDTADSFGLPSALLMMMASTQLDEAEKAQLVDFGRFLEEKNRDVQGLMNNDGMVYSLKYGLMGAGAFRDVFPLRQ